MLKKAILSLNIKIVKSIKQSLTPFNLDYSSSKFYSPSINTNWDDSDINRKIKHNNESNFQFNKLTFQEPEKILDFFCEEDLTNSIDLNKFVQKNIPANLIYLVLKSGRVDLNVRDELGNTWVHNILKNPYIQTQELIPLIREFGKNIINCLNHKNVSSLLIAVERGNVQLVSLFIEMRIDPRLFTKTATDLEFSPYVLAIEKNSTEIQDMLLNYVVQSFNISKKIPNQLMLISENNDLTVQKSKFANQIKTKKNKSYTEIIDAEAREVNRKDSSLC